MRTFKVLMRMACAAGVCGLTVGEAQAIGGDEAYSFTSGFAGDQINYPNSIGPSHASGDFGISGGNFDPNVGGQLGGFSYQGANLAFFDANNLLTAPSSLISNEAFWTDPRVFTRTTATGNSFSVSSLGFDLNDFDSVDTFGFSVAVASLAQAVPTSLPFQVQFGIGDSEFNPAIGNDTLNLLDDFSGGSFGYTVEAGTFQSLGSPFVGREARFEFNISDLKDLAGYDPEDSNGSFQFFFDIDTAGIDNNNGISLTQFAIDNVTLDGAAPVDPRPEPTLFTGPTPNGPFNPTVFDLTGDNTNANVVNIPAATQNGPIGLSVSSGAFDNPGDFQATLYTPGNANVSGLGEVSFGFGSTVAATAAVTAGPPDTLIALSDDVVLTLTADADQGGIVLGLFEIQALVDAELGLALQNAFAAASEGLDVAAALAAGLPVLTDSGMLADGEAEYLANTSATALLTLEAIGEIALVEGMQGASLVPTFNSNGEVVGARVSVWQVTARSGVLTAVASVPEPVSFAWFAAVATLATARRRRG
ncbi:MAG: hypothetical protein V3V20_08420 [Algisphaera sp.]